MRKKELKEMIDNLKKTKDDFWNMIAKQDKELCELKRKNEKLNLDYMALLIKYKKILKIVSEKETKNIVHNGKLYAITGVSHYQKAGEVENIVITANNIPEKEGLVNSMGKVFKEVYDSINETLFGDKK